MFLQSLPSRIPPIEQAKAVWENTLEDQLEGLLSKWLSTEDLDNMFGPGAWMASIRFAIWQKAKYRMIDDASGEINGTFGSEEQIHTTSAVAAAALTRRFREVLGRLRKAKRLNGSSRDMKKAYKQIGVTEDQLRFAVIAVFDPTQKYGGSPFHGRSLLGWRARYSTSTAFLLSLRPFAADG